MSRHLPIWTVVTAAVLIATTAKADRECFENTCRLPEVTAPPVQRAPSLDIDENAPPSGTAAPEAGARPAEPLRPGAQMIVDPAPLRPADRARAPADHSPGEPIGSGDFASANPVVVRRQKAGSAAVSMPARNPVEAEREHASAEAGERPAMTGAVGAPRARADHPSVRPDSNWMLCQVRQREAAEPAYLCGPYNHYAFDAYGSRPHPAGSGHRAGPVYIVAPDAKIISIEPSDER